MGYLIEEFRGILSHEDLPEEIVPGIERCIQSAFGGGITQEDANRHMAGEQILVARRLSDENIVGFSTASITSPQSEFGDPLLPDDMALYLAGVAIDVSAQGTGLYHELNRMRFTLADEYGLKMAFTRTQNPRVEEGVVRAIEAYTSSKQYLYQEIGRVICQGTYGRMLTSSRPEARKVSYSTLDYERGDAVIIMWQFFETIQQLNNHLK